MDNKFVSKGWGWEHWIVNNIYCGKRMFVKKDKRCSFHYHINKTETFYIDSGKILLKWLSSGWKDAILANQYSPEALYKFSNELILTPGNSFHLYPFMAHQFIGLEDSYFYEFSTHHEDSDSYRLIKGD